MPDTRKRKRNGKTCQRKRTKKEQPWISATRIKNYILKDPCIDWLATQYTNIQTCSDTNILFESGRVFEKKIYDELKEVYKTKFVVIFSDKDYEEYRKDKTVDGIIRQRYNETVSHMKSGMPIIGQAVMMNDSNQTFGIADLLVRSDYLEILFEHFTPDKEINVGTSFGTPYHYRVIDCKWTTLILCSSEKNKTNIRNYGLIPAYKGQLAIYTACLQQMQGYAPHFAYMMARAFKIKLSKQHNVYIETSCFDRLGVVDYKKFDKQYLELTEQAISWVKRVLVEGHKWNYNQRPPVCEIYPNMSKNVNPAFAKIKQQLAEQYGEITQLWYAAEKHRKNAFKHKVFNIHDPRCTLKCLGIDPKSNRARVQNEILKINYWNNPLIVAPKIILNNDGCWQEDTKYDYFIDFETINNALYSDPLHMNIDDAVLGQSFIFMIGIGFQHDPNVQTKAIIKNMNKNKMIFVSTNIDRVAEWEYVCFCMKKFINNDSDISNRFIEFITARSILTKQQSCKLFHWSDAEKTLFKNAQARARITNKQLQMEWIDLYKIFTAEPIVIKKAFCFKLKQIARAFCFHKLINTIWDDNDVSNGFDAMLYAIHVYRTQKSTAKQLKSIIKYNEVDCRVMWEIVCYLREHHIRK